MIIQQTACQIGFGEGGGQKLKNKANHDENHMYTSVLIMNIHNPSCKMCSPHLYWFLLSYH